MTLCLQGATSNLKSIRLSLRNLNTFHDSCSRCSALLPPFLSPFIRGPFDDFVLKILGRLARGSQVVKCRLAQICKIRALASSSLPDDLSAFVACAIFSKVIPVNREGFLLFLLRSRNVGTGNGSAVRLCVAALRSPPQWSAVTRSDLPLGLRRRVGLPGRRQAFFEDRGTAPLMFLASIRAFSFSKSISAS